MKKHCQNHLSEIAGMSMDELAIKVGDLHYQALMNFFFHLHKKLEADAENDYKGKRTLLAARLQNLSCSVFESAKRSESIWKLCKPFMDETI